MWNKQRPWRPRARQHGVTLVELIIAMVIIGVGIAGMTAVFTRTTGATIDPMIQKQMLAAAEGIMEEVLLKPYDINPEPATVRAEFNDVRDFHRYGLNAGGTPILGITDVNGAAVPGLGRYSVEVRVLPTNLNGLACAPATECALLITVIVRRGANALTLTGWRTDFA